MEFLSCPLCETPAIPASGTTSIGAPTWSEDDTATCEGCGVFLRAGLFEFEEIGVVVLAEQQETLAAPLLYKHKETGHVVCLECISWCSQWKEMVAGVRLVDETGLTFFPLISLKMYYNRIEGESSDVR